MIGPIVIPQIHLGQGIWKMLYVYFYIYCSSTGCSIVILSFQIFKQARKWIFTLELFAKSQNDKTCLHF